jgi:bifunctional non-homologous end joining protein LigD
MCLGDTCELVSGDMALSVITVRSMEQVAGDDGPEKKRPRARAEDTLRRLLQRYSGVQLATLVDRPPAGKQWVHEIKLDGYRLLGFVAGGVARLLTRNGKDWTEKFSLIVDGLEKLRVRKLVLDMEAVVFDVNGKTSFQALQQALGGAENSAKVLAYAFDILHLDGKDLTKLPLTDRKAKLKALLKGSGQLLYSGHTAGQGAKMLAKACSMGLEGIVSKKADAPYTAGRQKTWLKTKCAQRQEFIILGYSIARTGERALGALYLGYRKDSCLRYAGKVGTGFTMQGAIDLAKRLTKLAVAKPLLTRTETGRLPAGEWQSIRWVKPVLLCEVAFTEWTHDGRIRHPSFQGLREDKDARYVTKERPLATTSTSAPQQRQRKRPGA